MADERFLIIRLGSLGDLVHTLPAVAALRDAFPAACIDWVVERKWAALLHGSPDINEVIPLERNWRGSTLRRLRTARYTCALDFQGLYKSGLLAFLSGARQRLGFSRGFARESGAAFFYTQRVSPPARHVVEQNRALAEMAGGRRRACRFALRVPAEIQADVDRRLAAAGLLEFFVVSPGGGWRSKSWPAERYGELCRELARGHGWHGVVNFGPGERDLVETVCRAAAAEQPIKFETDIPRLMALLGRAKIVVAGDTGPLHLAVALGTPVVGLYGPTDPERNGPYCADDIVVRNARAGETTYKRGSQHSASMLSITVGQVLTAVEQRLARAAAKHTEAAPGTP
jgi:lipopolysaccharide heptosyltransferase I